MTALKLADLKRGIRRWCEPDVTGNIFIMELREEFSVCLNNEALSRGRVYLYTPFYSRERENAKLRGTILSENGEINKT